MTTTALLPTSTTPATDVTVCDTCGHDDARHDVISRRYCAATMAGALTRGCICGGR